MKKITTIAMTLVLFSLAIHAEHAHTRTYNIAMTHMVKSKIFSDIDKAIDKIKNDTSDDWKVAKSIAYLSFYNESRADKERDIVFQGEMSIRKLNKKLKIYQKKAKKILKTFKNVNGGLSIETDRHLISMIVKKKSGEKPHIVVTEVSKNR